MKKFIKFLENNNAWEKFERAFIEQRRDVKRYKEFCKAFKDRELSNAFVWANTREGDDYWYKLNSKWIEENKSLKEKLLNND